MKYIKSYKIFESIDLELDKILKNYFINKHTLNEDGSIDVNEDVNLLRKNLNEIPFKFNKVKGYFDIRGNKLISLKNCPKYIEYYFDCSYNHLKTLEFGPEYVGTDYFCYNNKLETLKGCIEEVYGNFNCMNNKLKSLEFCPMQVEGWLECSNNKLEYLDRSPFIKGCLFCQKMFKFKPEFNGFCEPLIWK